MSINKLTRLVADRKLFIALSLNPTPDCFPLFVGKGADGLFEFNKLVVDALAEIAGAVCVDSDVYSRYGVEGMSVFAKTLDYISSRGLFSVSDGTDLFESDAVVVNPYGEASPNYFAWKANSTGVTYFMQINSFDRNVENMMLKMINETVYCTLTGDGYCGMGISVVPRDPVRVGEVRDSFKDCFFLIKPATMKFYDEAVRCCFTRDATGAAIRTDSRFFDNCAETKNADELTELIKKRFRSWNERAHRVLFKKAYLIR